MFTGTVRRLFWVSLGATVGVLVFRKVTSAAKELTPAGISDRVAVDGGGLLDSVKEFFEDVREAAHDREEELNVALGIDVPPADDRQTAAKQSGDKLNGDKQNGADPKGDGSSKKARAI
jgi:hypothetical protein